MKLTYESGQEVEVDAEAYMNELSSQVSAVQLFLLLRGKLLNQLVLKYEKPLQM